MQVKAEIILTHPVAEVDLNRTRGIIEALAEGREPVYVYADPGDPAKLLAEFQGTESSQAELLEQFSRAFRQGLPDCHDLIFNFSN